MPKYNKFFGKHIKNEEDEKLFNSIDKSKKIKDYLETLSNETSTRGSYKRSIYRMFFFNKIKEPDKLILNPDLLSNKKKIELKQRWKEIIFKYVNNCGLSPKGTKAEISAIRGLLEFYEIEINGCVFKKLNKINGNFVITEKETPNQKILSDILSHTNVEGKALFMLQATTGSRIEEILNLTLNDIDLDREIGRIRIQHYNSKNKRPITKFFTNETKDVILEYLKIRDEKLKSRANRTRNNVYRDGSKNLDYNNDNRLFPMTKANANDKWLRILKRAGYYKKDNATGRATMTTHCLRRFFRNQFGKYDSNIAKLLMNQITDLDRVYLDIPIEELEEKYKEGSDCLLIFKTKVDNSEEMKKLKSEIDYLKDEIRKISESRIKFYTKEGKDVSKEIFEKLDRKTLIEILKEGDTGKRFEVEDY